MVVALVVAALIGVLALVLNRPADNPASGATGMAAGAPSCDREWQVTLVTCDEARRSISTGMAPIRAVHIWLTTLAAVDSQLQPNRQVADHPADPATPVWLFIYEGDQVPIVHADESGTLVQAPPEGKLLHVTNANDPATTGGAFIYVYLWTELGAPPMPVLLPTPAIQQAAASLAPDAGATTCARWLDITDAERIALADRLVGASGDRLERIRKAQRRPEGTARDILIRDVVASLTKNCEIWPQREVPVGKIMDALY